MRDESSARAPSTDGRVASAGGGTLDVARALSAVGEVAYEWTIADDRLVWGPNVADVFGSEAPIAMASGRAYAALADPDNTASRQDAILNGAVVDRGSGVPYEAEYRLAPDGADGKRQLVVEDVGRWYAGPNGRPARAVGVVRVVTERREREQRLAFLSRYDELTGFFNRAHLLTTLGEALDDAKRGRASIAFLIVAIDNFRAINEAYGFEAADQVFAAAARRIGAELRDGDAVGRYSGNKLGVLLMDCDEQSMAAAAERFHAAVRNGVISAKGSSVAVTVSIGGVTLPRYGRTVNEALGRAQESLHRARASGWGRFAAFSPSPQDDKRRLGNAAISSEMVAALEANQLRVFFQPVVDIESRQPRFHEGLLRLERPGGEVSAAHEFIELSEQLGLIRLIDKYALEHTLAALKAQPEAVVSINVSGETVGDGEWLSKLARAAAEDAGLAKRLIVEITETAVIHNLDDAQHFVATLHDLGCRAAIDDFGAGFSSFRSLRSLGVDIVKIAGEFVHRLPESADDRAFVRALTDLAHSFGIEIVAEWVENEETAVLLADYGVHMIQGNLCGAATAEWSLRMPNAAAAVRRAV